MTNELTWKRMTGDDDEGEIYVVYGLAPEADEAAVKYVAFVDAPASETGGKFNGLTNEVVIDILIDRIGRLNAKYPCRENSLAITHLQEALFWLEERTRQRRTQAVEGQYAAHQDDRAHYRA